MELEWHQSYLITNNSDRTASVVDKHYLMPDGKMDVPAMVLVKVGVANTSNIKFEARFKSEIREFAKLADAKEWCENKYVLHQLEI